MHHKNEAFNNLYKKDKGRKRISEKGLGNYILELVEKGLAKEDGYELKPLNTPSKEQIEQKTK